MLRSSTSLAILTLALVACDQGTTRRNADAANADESSRAIEAPAPSVRTIELGKSAGPSLRVTSATSTFATTDTMFLAVIVANPDSDSRLTARWSSEDGSVIDSSGQNVARDMGTSSSVTQFRVMHDKAWPVGKYTVDVWMNGVLAGTKMFTVAR